MSAARDLAYGLDPVEFSRAAGLDPDAWQARLLRSTAPRILVNCSRQSGKSTTAATLALHAAIYEPGALVLLLSPTLRQSGEMLRKCLDTYRALGRPVAPDAENKLSLELETGARIVSLPGAEATIRGFSGVRLLLVDEASRVPDDLYHSVTPMLAVSQGRLVALSTPWGRRGWWFTAWQSRDAWERYEVPASECPRIPAAFLEEQRRELGDFWFAQEFECRFLDAETAAFRQVDIDRAFKQGVETWTDDLRHYMSGSTWASRATPARS